MSHRSVGEEGQHVDRSPLDTLSYRELLAFRLTGRGLKTHDIATRLHLSIQTDATDRDRIRAKLDPGNGTKLIRFAFQWSLKNG